MYCIRNQSSDKIVKKYFNGKYKIVISEKKKATLLSLLSLLVKPYYRRKPAFIKVVAYMVENPILNKWRDSNTIMIKSIALYVNDKGGVS